MKKICEQKNENGVREGDMQGESEPSVWTKKLNKSMKHLNRCLSRQQDILWFEFLPQWIICPTLLLFEEVWRVGLWEFLLSFFPVSLFSIVLV